MFRDTRPFYFKCKWNVMFGQIKETESKRKILQLGLTTILAYALHSVGNTCKLQLHFFDIVVMLLIFCDELKWKRRQ